MPIIVSAYPTLSTPQLHSYNNTIMILLQMEVVKRGQEYPALVVIVVALHPPLHFPLISLRMLLLMLLHQGPTTIPELLAAVPPAITPPLLLAKHAFTPAAAPYPSINATMLMAPRRPMSLMIAAADHTNHPSITLWLALEPLALPPLGVALVSASQRMKTRSLSASR